ncbi:MAG: alpha/beta fold hydrolase, partial [Actinomycetota bacterium]|nr:alpha/beta fold hydrolase [Actinomycetota bacterium]
MGLHRVFDWRGPDRVVLVHGFTQTLRSWDPLAAVLADTFQIVRVDLPGHGASSEVRMGFAETAAAIGDAGGQATYVGYSMGGRLCLRLAADRPDLVQALVLVGASP